MSALTLQQILESFELAIATQNPSINPNVSGTDWSVWGNALSAIVSGMYQDINSNSNGVFIQFSSGLFLDYRAFSLDQPARFGSTFALVDATNATPPTTTITASKGTEFVSAFNNNTYVLISDTTISSSGPTTFSLQAKIVGENQQLPVGSELSATISSQPITISVTMSTDGQPPETDAQLRLRLLGIMQNPVGAARTQQYVSWALASSPNINGAIVVPNFSGPTIGVFVLSGSTDYDNILLSATPFSRTTDSADAINASAYLINQAPVNVQLQVATVSTYTFSNTLSVNVVLAPTLTLASVVSNIDGSSITIENFIIQEIRRGVITYPYQGTQIDATDDRWILISRLEQTLDSSLSVNGGIYGQFIVDRSILYDGGAGDIPVPFNVVDGNGNLECVYDSLNANITVGLL